MNKTITISVKNKIAKNITPDAVYVCGNIDFKVNFAFDAEWDGYITKTARFITQHNAFVDVIFQGNVCNMPILENTHLVHVGVYAGNLSTTTPAVIPAKKSILCDAGVPADPVPDVYAQIMEYLQQLEQNGVTDEQIEKVITDYLAENPIEGVTPEEVQAEVNRALTAAKESGEFKGEPGKDGKDGKDGYTPQKGIDYFDGVDGKDGKDGKDGADAPPYTLPVASADTLGGVKVGEGLQMTDDALGVVPEAMFDEEPLVALTLQEKVDTVTIDQDADGQPLNLKALLVRVELPAAEAESVGYVYCGDDTNRSAFGAYFSQMFATASRVAVFVSWPVFGRWFALGLGAGYNPGSNNGISNYPVSNLATTVNVMPRIKSVWVSSKSAMPVGTVIKVYGVR